MNKFRLLAIFTMLLMTVSPVGADNEKEAETENNYEEIDNYDFLYNDNAGNSDFTFATVDEMLEEAFSHVGAKYRSGMSGPTAFDCSGFTSYVFRNMGISLGRSSRAQYSDGEAVNKGNIQTGDLVFFTSRGSGRNIGHVGIVVDVDQLNGSFNFIHASMKGVKVSNSKEPYYSRRYVGARRVM